MIARAQETSKSELQLKRNKGFRLKTLFENQLVKDIIWKSNFREGPICNYKKLNMDLKLKVQGLKSKYREVQGF
jgi:hypothetical protein